MSHASRVVGTLGPPRVPLVDPRDGDIESDASSMESRSLFALAGSLLIEVSLPKVAAALVLLVVLPAVLVGLTPLLATIWWSTLPRRRERTASAQRCSLSRSSRWRGSVAAASCASSSKASGRSMRCRFSPDTSRGAKDCCTSPNASPARTPARRGELVGTRRRAYLPV